MQTTYLASIILLLNCILGGVIEVNNCKERDTSAVTQPNGSTPITFAVANGNGKPDGEDSWKFRLAMIDPESLIVKGEEVDFSDITQFGVSFVTVGGIHQRDEVEIQIPLKGQNNEADLANGYVFTCEYSDASGFTRRELRNLLVI